MEKLTDSVANVKRHFSEYVNRTAFSECRVIITKRNRPIAAIINLKDLQALEQSDKRKGLFSVTRKWKDFEELEESISKAVKERQEEGDGRDVSL